MFSLHEKEATDAIYRSKAVSAFEIVHRKLQTLTSDELIEEIFFVRSDGGIITTAENLGLLNDDGLLILFSPPSNISGGFGFLQGHPLLMFNFLIAANDFRHLDTRFSGIRKTFVHEYIHYLDWKRTAGRITGVAKRYEGKPIPVAAYINNPTEFNAYYQEGVDMITSYMKDWVPVKNIPALFGTSFESFLKIAKEKYFAEHFISYMDSSYEKKFIKRIYDFYNQVVEPWVTERLAEEI